MTDLAAAIVEAAVLGTAAEPPRKVASPGWDVSTLVEEPDPAPLIVLMRAAAR